MIQLDLVSKHFQRGGNMVRALEGVTLSVPEGALAVLRGPSGSGKTTLIHLCAGLALPTSGRLTVAGARVDQLGPAASAQLRAQSVAVVFQMFHLVPYLTTLENVLLPVLARPVEDAVSRAIDLLGRLGLAGRAVHRPAELSAGERQRCALARALLADPKVILADEPTGNLDEESAAVVLSMLDACRREGRTVLMVSHQHAPSLRPDLEFNLRAGKLEG